MQLLLWELEQLLQDLNAHGDGSLTEAFEQHLSATRRLPCEWHGVALGRGLLCAASVRPRRMAFFEAVRQVSPWLRRL